MADTVKVTVTMRPGTVEWLEGAYPDGTSRSQRVLMAVSDARTFQKMMGKKDVFTEVSRE